MIGGLGGAVCECLSENCPTKVCRIGVHDRFGESGKASELIKMFGFDGEGVYNTVREFVKKNS